MASHADEATAWLSDKVARWRTRSRPSSRSTPTPRTRGWPKGRRSLAGPARAATGRGLRAPQRALRGPPRVPLAPGAPEPGAVALVGHLDTCSRRAPRGVPVGRHDGARPGRARHEGGLVVIAYALRALAATGGLDALPSGEPPLVVQRPTRTDHGRRSPPVAASARSAYAMTTSPPFMSSTPGPCAVVSSDRYPSKVPGANTRCPGCPTSATAPRFGSSGRERNTRWSAKRSLGRTKASTPSRPSRSRKRAPTFRHPRVLGVGVDLDEGATRVRHRASLCPTARRWPRPRATPWRASLAPALA